MAVRRVRAGRVAAALVVAAAALVGVAGPARAGAGGAGSGGDGTVWLCKPGQRPDPCVGSTATTIQRTGRPPVVVTPPQPARHPIDCFYVYPTVSDEPTPNASLTVTPPVQAIAEAQASRFSQLCNVYAPVYRQVTLTAANGGTTSPPDPALGYGDVLTAWRTYLARYNHGRGVVLIGHSQGSGVLEQLISQEIDKQPAVRRKLVSALLLGGNVLVKQGSDVGGTFANVPLCRRDGETGCVLAWSTFDQAPPADSAFGRAAAGSGEQVACTNPTSLSRNALRSAHTLQPTAPFPGPIGAALTILFNGAPPSAPTPWVVPADRYDVQCRTVNGAHVLFAVPAPGVRPLTPSPTPEFGLHLADVNIALGDLLRVVAGQELAYLLHGGR